MTAKSDNRDSNFGSSHGMSCEPDLLERSVLDSILRVGKQRSEVLIQLRDALNHNDIERILGLARELCGVDQDATRN